MHAKVKQSARYGSAQLFSGKEFVKFEWREVPAGFEDQARAHELLETQEGESEAKIMQKKVQEKVKPVMKARLVSDYKDNSLRTLTGKEYVKTEWRPVPDGFEQPARRHELLEIWEAGKPEPGKDKKPKPEKVRSTSAEVNE